jgi:HKD family nuclease
VKQRTRDRLIVCSTVTALALVVACFVGLVAAHGDDDPPPFQAHAGAAFNDPRGTLAEQNVLMDNLLDSIATSAPGTNIRIAIFSIDLPGFAQALVDAHKRGVHVKVLMDAHGATTGNKSWVALQKELGTKVDTSSGASFARACTGGCIAHHGPSYLHAKFYVFSGSGHPTVVVSSANPTGAQEYTAWNHSYTATGNQGLYDAYVSQFTLMAKTSVGKARTSAYSTYGSNPKAYFWPRGPSGADTILGMFNLVKCPSTIRIAMFQWSDSRVALANGLVKLGKAGCTIRILWTADQIGPKVKAALRSKPGIKTYDTTTGGGADGFAKHYTHSKYALIDGTYDGVPNQKISMSGSENYTYNAMAYNDESDLKITGGDSYPIFLENWQKQYDAAPSNAAMKARSSGEAPAIPVNPREVDGD